MTDERPCSSASPVVSASRLEARVVSVDAAAAGLDAMDLKRARADHHLTRLRTMVPVSSWTVSRTKANTFLKKARYSGLSK
jgi:hypothetical protein